MGRQRVTGRQDNLTVGTIAAVLATVVTVPLAAGTQDFAKAFGWPLTLLLWLLLVAGLFSLVALFYAYMRALEGATAPARSAARVAYVRLRRTAREGGSPGRLYALWLRRSLHATERFFGDSDTSAPHWLRRALGLREPAPLWSAAAFDRCLSFAMIYPAGILIGVWMITGHVGVAERSLGLPAQLHTLARALIGGLALGVVAGEWAARRFTGWQSLACSLSSSACIGLAFWVGGRGAATLVLLMFLVGREVGPLSGMRRVAMVVAGASAAVSVPASLGQAVGILAVASVLIGVSAGLPWLATWAARAIGSARFAAAAWAVLLVIATGAALFSTGSQLWTGWAPALLFLGVLTLVNAPFDWLSLGVTRALLRLGLEQGGPWPLLLAAADAVLAVLIVVALGAAMVVAVQAFDLVAICAGHQPLLPMTPLLDALSVDPAAVEHWWLHALLMSTLVPSGLNLCLACTSLMRSHRSVVTWLMRRLPESRGQGDAVLVRSLTIATVLTAQWAVGVVAGLLALGLVIWVVIGLVMPAWGFGLLELMRALADANLPERLVSAWR